MAKRAAHSAPDLPIESGEELPPRKSRVERLLDVIERAGNKVPHPVVIFVMLIGILILLSHIFYLFGATVTFQTIDPETEELVESTVTAQSLLTADGFRFMFTGVVDNFMSFTAVGVIIVAMLGVGVAEEAGLVRALIHKLVLVAPRKAMTYILVFIGILSSVAAVLAVGLYRFASPRFIARCAFLVTTVALALLAAVIRNDWGTGMIISGMVLAGLGEGALVALLFNVLVSASPKELAGDVGSLRGCTNNLAAGVGTAVASALVVSVLGAGVHRNLVHSPLIPDELKAEFNLNEVPFVSNDRLLAALATTAATDEQTQEAVRINTEARLVALKISLFALSGLALLAFFPSGALPGHALGNAPGRE